MTTYSAAPSLFWDQLQAIALRLPDPLLGSLSRQASLSCQRVLRVLLRTVHQRGSASENQDKKRRPAVSPQAHSCTRLQWSEIQFPRVPSNWQHPDKPQSSGFCGRKEWSQQDIVHKVLEEVTNREKPLQDGPDKYLRQSGYAVSSRDIPFHRCSP